VDLTLTADQRDLQAAVRDYLAGTWTPDRLRSAADDAAVDRKDWRALAELGIFGLTLPEADGGLGLGLADAVIVFEELGRALVPGPLVATFLAAGLVSGAVDGGAVVTMLDASEPVAVVEHLASASHVILVDDDGLFVLPAAALNATITELDGSRRRQTPAGQMTSATTRPTPGRPIARAAPLDRSSTRPRMNGPRSLMVTTTLRSPWVTLSLVPNGRVRWAAVMAF